MCYYLTVAVLGKNSDQIAVVFGRGFQTCLTANPSIRALLPADFKMNLVISGTCSCSLYSRPGQATAVDATDHLRRKYEQRG